MRAKPHADHELYAALADARTVFGTEGVSLSGRRVGRRMVIEVSGPGVTPGLKAITHVRGAEIVHKNPEAADGLEGVDEGGAVAG